LAAAPHGLFFPSADIYSLSAHFTTRHPPLDISMSKEGIEVLGAPIDSPLYVDRWLAKKTNKLINLVVQAESILHNNFPLAFLQLLWRSPTPKFVYLCRVVPSRALAAHAQKLDDSVRGVTLKALHTPALHPDPVENDLRWDLAQLKFGLGLNFVKSGKLNDDLYRRRRPVSGEPQPSPSSVSLISVLWLQGTVVLNF